MTPEAKAKLEAHLVVLKSKIEDPDRAEQFAAMASLRELINIRRILNDPDFNDVMQRRISDFSEGVTRNLMFAVAGISFNKIK